MKRWFLAVAFAGMVHFCNAQSACNVIISGDTCVSSILTANTTGRVVDS